MKVTYLYHSGFAVELEKHVLIFDYYKGKLPRWDGEKSILFFASHKHHDHFDFIIFDYVSQYKNCHYFLSSDIKLSDRYLERNKVQPSIKEQITHVGKNTALEWGDIKIETLRSTDEGVAFIISAEGKVLYHGGDLNWWHWEGEAPAWNKQMEADYKREISRISKRHFHVAFVPLDPRLEAAYDYGIKEFLVQCDADAVFPMHMWDRYDMIEKYKKSESGRAFAEKIKEIQAPGQEFIL